MLNKLDALKYFCTAAETLNFRAAAEQLAVTPPVISRTVAELEDELGEQLFRRSTRTIKLTNFGEQFYLHAKQLLAWDLQADGQSYTPLSKLISSPTTTPPNSLPPWLVELSAKSAICFVRPI